MIAVSRLNHAVLFASELERAVEFYQQVLGMTVIAVAAREVAGLARWSGVRTA